MSFNLKEITKVVGKVLSRYEYDWVKLITNQNFWNTSELNRNELQGWSDMYENVLITKEYFEEYFTQIDWTLMYLLTLTQSHCKHYSNTTQVEN